MHTQLSCKVYGKQPEAAIEAAFAEVKRLELLLSRFLPDSEVSSINAQAGKTVWWMFPPIPSRCCRKPWQSALFQAARSM
jgi:thiamine biosynthesis lipoprotein ApbE